MQATAKPKRAELSRKIRDKSVNNNSNVSVNSNSQKNSNNIIKTKARVHFPLKNQQDLLNLENDFKEDSDFQEDVTEMLSRRGGKDYSDLTNNIMYKIITDKFAEQFSLKGRQKKKNFSQYILCKLVTSAVCRMFDKCTEYEVELKIGTWLANASSRLARRTDKSKSLTEKDAESLSNE